MMVCMKEMVAEIEVKPKPVLPKYSASSINKRKRRYAKRISNEPKYMERIRIAVSMKWNTPEQIVSAPDSVCWTPVLIKQLDGELLLFYRIGFDPRHTISLFKRSCDEGVSWSEAEILPAGIVGPTKSKPIFDNEGSHFTLFGSL